MGERIRWLEEQLEEAKGQGTKLAKAEGIISASRVTLQEVQEVQQEVQKADPSKFMRVADLEEKLRRKVDAAAMAMRKIVEEDVKVDGVDVGVQ